MQGRCCHSGKVGTSVAEVPDELYGMVMRSEVRGEATIRPRFCRKTEKGARKSAKGV